MKIVEIKFGKSKSKVITDSGEYEFATDTVYRHSLKTECEIDDDFFFEIREESDKILAKEYIFSLLSRYLKSKLQAKRKLKEKGFSDSAIEYAIAIAEEYKYIDDKNYTSCYINTYIRRKGQRLMKYELKSAGVEEEIILNALDGRNEQMLESAIKIAEKFLQRKSGVTKDKLYGHLSSRGYDYDTIYKAINNVMSRYEL